MRYLVIDLCNNFKKDQNVRIEILGKNYRDLHFDPSVLYDRRSNFDG